MFFLFDVGPLFSSALLVLVHALLEFFIPNVSRGDVPVISMIRFISAKVVKLSELFSGSNGLFDKWASLTSKPANGENG